MSSNKISPWFYYPQVVTVGEPVQLPDDEARHLTGSRRMEVGSELTLFDGRGHIASAAVTSVGSRGRNVVITATETHIVEPSTLNIHLASALPKGDRLSVMLDMVTQLGISSFTPLECERSIVKTSDNALTRWERIMVEACKQSRRAYLPELNTSQKPEQVLTQARGHVWLAHPDGVAAVTLAPVTEGSLTLMIGPEGGFTDTEVGRLSARGARVVSLGEGILRIETAAVSLLACARMVAEAAE